MRRCMISIIFIVLLFCSGCSGEKPLSEHQFDLSNTSAGQMIETENGYYMLRVHSTSPLIMVYYADKEDLTKWVPVCNKPDCKHDYNCNADVGLAQMMSLENDKIYTYSENDIKRMDLTGGNQEIVKSIKLEGYGHSIVEWFHFNGKILRSHVECEYNGIAELETALWENRIILFDPETGEDTILYEIIGPHKSYRFNRVKNASIGAFDIQHLYLQPTIFDEWAMQNINIKDIEALKSIKSTGGYYEFISETNEIVQLSGEGYENILGTIGEKTFSFEEGKGIVVDGEVLIAAEEEKCYAGIAHEYIVVDKLQCENPEEGLVFYDAEGKELGHLFENAGGKRAYAAIWGYSDEHIFIRTSVYGENSEDMHVEFGVIDAKALAKGKIEYTIMF